MLERIKQYQDHWATLSGPEREIQELLATRELLQGDMVDEDGNICSLWDHAVNTQLEEVSAETGLARDTDAEPEDVRSCSLLTRSTAKKTSEAATCRSSRASQAGCSDGTLQRCT